MGEKETFGAEIAKQIPVKEIYQDLFQPTLSTLGKTLQGATRVALAPISAMIWGYDKIANYLDVAIPEYFVRRKVTQEQIQSPDPSIAVPIIEAMRYTYHKEELRDMFTNLLGASMNTETYQECHPAFVEFIKQLVPDECKMLKYLFVDNRQPILKVRMNLHSDNGQIDVLPYFSDIGYRCNCEFPEKFSQYLDNLSRLGLVDVYRDRYFKDDRHYQKLREYPDIKKLLERENGNFEESKGFYELSQLGKTFCKICITTN